MATSKTLTPTNVTIQIPAFTDQPDQRVNSNCIDKEADAINALNSKIADLPKFKLVEKTINFNNSDSVSISNFASGINVDKTKIYTVSGIIKSANIGITMFYFYSADELSIKANNSQGNTDRTVRICVVLSD